jgi:hypothetical protein
MALRGGKISGSRGICRHRLFDGQNQGRGDAVAKAIKVCYDAEGDFLEVLFSQEPGFMRATNHDAVMERVSDF